MDTAALVQGLRRIVGENGVSAEAHDQLVYEYDASFDTHVPAVVVWPTTPSQVVEIVHLANAAGVPLVPRGAGTGIAGGAIPTRGGIVVVTTRMNRLLALDARNRRAVVEPGYVNLDLSVAAAPHGLFFAPDPASQKISTIGGNVATNAGGVHCLAWGATTNHILGLEVVTPTGEVIQTGALAVDAPGYDLTGVITGSEGTLGIVTKVMVRLMRLPEASSLLMAVFADLTDASQVVSATIASGIVPVAMEMIDGLTCRVVESAFHLGFPDDAGGMLLIEIDGLTDGLDDVVASIAGICRRHGARQVRLAASAAERDALWAARKGALGCMGRLAPNYYVQDGVVPRTQLPRTIDHVTAVARDYDLLIANVFHAGDGNLHPLILFDRRTPGVVQRTLEASLAILRYCVELGGAISGEHGIALEKRDAMTLLFTTDDLIAMAGLKRALNPRDLLNPDKVFPAALGCGEVRDLAAGAVRGIEHV
ncbi:MAG: FAD-binding protein [Chloroflexi bacterium]|nr:FAD-binding protein [Chloroflexota bacterium]